MNTKKYEYVLKIIMLIALTALITFMITTALIYGKTPNNVKYIITSSDSTELGKTLTSYEDFIKKQFYGEINEEQAIEYAIAGYVAGLGDKYSEYISRKNMQEYLEQTNGKYSGVGAYITNNQEKNRVEIVSVIKNSPAEKIGLKPGDLILKVNGVEYEGSQLTETSNAMKGVEGTKVELEILRDEEILVFTIERQTIKINPIEVETLDNNIGYIQISSFDNGTFDDFKSSYEKFAQNNIKGLIIDLRNNGGGIVDEALEIADLMAEKDKILLYIVGNNDSEEIKKSTNDMIINIPVIFLVNGNTASASEILVAAVKENNSNCRVVGKNTYGKGVIQTVFSLKDGGGLKLTTNEYLTPNKNKINGIGIKPDYEVLLPDDKAVVESRENDTQLNKAIELLK